MRDNIIPFKRRNEQPKEVASLAEAVAAWPEDKPILMEIRVQEPPTR